jgi:hypothetical protein
MLLADFSSILQVSVGLHLAYTILPDLHGFYLAEVEKYANSATKFAENPPIDCDPIFLQDRIRILRYVINERRREVKHAILWMQAVAICVAFFSVLLLAVAAMCPRLILDIKTALFLLIVALAPMPVFCLLSYVSHRRWLKRIASEHKNVQNEWTRLMQPTIERLTSVGADKT